MPAPLTLNARDLEALSTAAYFRDVIQYLKNTAAKTFVLGLLNILIGAFLRESGFGILLLSGTLAALVGAYVWLYPAPRAARMQTAALAVLIGAKVLLIVLEPLSLYTLMLITAVLLEVYQAVQTYRMSGDFLAAAQQVSRELLAELNAVLGEMGQVDVRSRPDMIEFELLEEGGAGDACRALRLPNMFVIAKFVSKHGSAASFYRGNAIAAEMLGTAWFSGRIKARLRMDDDYLDVLIAPEMFERVQGWSAFHAVGLTTKA